jgi:hypothetical protein
MKLSIKVAVGLAHALWCCRAGIGTSKEDFTLFHIAAEGVKIIKDAHAGPSFF